MITKEELKDRIVKVIEDRSGILASEFFKLCDAEMFEILSIVDLPTAIAELLHEKRIVEIECSLPNGKSRSFLLPAGTEIYIHDCK
jgi:hypothetical protein